MASKKVYLGLDVGSRRIGLAVADSIARIAQPIATVLVGDDELKQLECYLHDHEVTDIVVGRPRNQSGETTAQTKEVEQFVGVALKGFTQPIHWQDESVTSVIAEERLKARKKPYSKADIDAEAAAIILQDFMEAL